MEGESPSDTNRSQIPWHSAVFYVIISSSLIGVMGVSLISPLLPALRPVFGVTDTAVGLFITAYSIPGIFITPFIGYVADRIGRKWVLVPLLFTFGIAGAGIAFTTNFLIALGLRFLQGIGATALVMLAVTLIGDIYEGNRRDTLIGMNGSMIGVGAAFYPLLGGALATVRWSVPFLFFGVAIPVGLLALLALDGSTGASDIQLSTYTNRIYEVVQLPEALALFAAMFLAVFIYYGAVVTALPLLLSDEFGLTSSKIGLILAVAALANAVTSSLYGRISRRRTAPELISLGFVAFGIGLLLIWISSTTVLIAVALLGFGIGLGLALPSIDMKVITLVSEDLRAGMMGMRTSMLRLGQTIGAVGFTFAAETFFVSTVQGYRSLMLLAGVIVIGTSSLLYVLFRH
ncbi:MFS transporter [Halobacterium sp. R2-5]|uniref:MFS transporter n=1 Tax=Halobacterium sp. R2-5 TaxID=2715751 RepID=UPI00141F3B3E|nr:MFS transporter [Halobacterium sp. R2-5]NIC00914.1 MFS transporter [Halobacterium sp. R2-5]